MTSDNGYIDLQMVRYCLNYCMTLQIGVETSLLRVTHFVKSLSQFAAGIAEDPGHQKCRERVEAKY
jgi:hypothetical protein